MAEKKPAGISAGFWLLNTGKMRRLSGHTTFSHHFL
jgi:hypothetical protein